MKKGFTGLEIIVAIGFLISALTIGTGSFDKAETEKNIITTEGGGK